MATKYQVTDSKGRVHKRTTKDRTYTHAVVVDYVSNYSKDEGGNFRHFTNVQWAGRPDLAQKVAARERAYAGNRGVEIIPTT